MEKIWLDLLLVLGVLLLVGFIVLRQEKIMAKIDDLEAAVSRNASAEESVLTLLQGISQELQAAKGDPDKINQLITQLDERTDRLAAAVVANTPAVEE